MRLLWKYIRNYFLVYHLISHFLLYLQNYKEFEAETLDLQLEKYGLLFDIKEYTTSGWALGNENVIGIRSFKMWRILTTLPSEKNGSVDVTFMCAITHQKHLTQSGRSTRSSVDIFNTLHVFTKEPIREQEITLECMNCS